jgi:hypothetical protein
MQRTLDAVPGSCSVQHAAHLAVCSLQEQTQSAAGRVDKAKTKLIKRRDLEFAACRGQQDAACGTSPTRERTRGSNK